MKKVLLLGLALITVLCLVACGKEEPKEQNVEENNIVEENNVVEEEVNVPKSEQEGTAGSNIPLIDNIPEAENQIKIAMENLLKETYGDDIVDSKINVTRIYSAEDEETMPELKDYNLTENEVAFEVNYEIKPAEGVDANMFTAGTGVYDEETGWVTEKYNLGILRPNTSGDAKYVITNFGTGW